MAKSDYDNYLQVGYKTWIVLDIPEEEYVFVKEANRDYENARGRERTYKKKVLSSDLLYENEGFEVMDESLNPLERLILEERNNYIMSAINKLTKIQKQVILDFFWKDKSLRQISRDRNVSITTVRESYHSALARLSVLLKDLDRYWFKKFEIYKC